jgi:pimeloyl-ACP methyl ester carboxylesterase
MPFYEKGNVRIHYQEAGSGFPLLLIAGGGLNSNISYFTGHAPFNPIEEFKGEYRCVAMDLRNANGGESSGPLEIDRPWDSYADDQLGLIDHLGIDKFMVMGFCIGGPFIWNLFEAGARAYRRCRAGATEREPSRDARPFLQQQYDQVGPGAVRAPVRYSRWRRSTSSSPGCTAPTPTSCSP